MSSPRCFTHLRTVLLASGVCLPETGLAAEQDITLSSRPTIGAVRIDTAEAPTIDGDLTDTAWAKAAVIEEFRQRGPVRDDPPTERTVVRIMYDENNLYFGIYAYDSEPDQIVVRTMQRDGQVYTGDNIFITLDPGPTWRNAYTFQVGPSSGRQDALRLNNAEELNAWDTLWSVEARIVSDGYILEFAIPFRSLSYPGDGGEWGLDIGRNIRRKNENVRWASTDPALSFADVSQAGVLTGISNVNQGLGLDVQPYVLFGAKHNWRLPGDGAGLTATMGGNVFYKITPSLTGTLTFNTDFSDAPLDARQVNTTRFSLFIPETRDFFLQDAGAFEFGGRAFTRDNMDRTANNGRPFFSRNIGLSDGVPVSIIAGAKLSGEFAGFGIGALSVVTDDTPTSGHQVLTVARVTRPVFENSRAGFIVTNGDPSGDTENTLIGGDFQYRTAAFLGGQTLSADANYQHSFSNALGDDNLFGIALNLPNEPWGGDFTFKQVGENFDPVLGFLNQPGIRWYDGSFRNVRRYRSDWLRRTTISTRQTFITDLSGHPETRISEFGGELETVENDVYRLRVTNYFEDIRASFGLPGGVIVPADDYRWTNLTLGLQTSNGRALSFGAEITCCRFFDGTNIEGSLTLTYRPNAYFSGEFKYEPAFIDLPGGDIDIHLFSLDASVNFTPDMSLAIQAQYDTLSEFFGSLARFRWEYSPGNEVLITFGQSVDTLTQRLRAGTSQLNLRLIRTFQF